MGVTDWSEATGRPGDEHLPQLDLPDGDPAVEGGADRSSCRWRPGGWPRPPGPACRGPRRRRGRPGCWPPPCAGLAARSQVEPGQVLRRPSRPASWASSVEVSSRTRTAPLLHAGAGVEGDLADRPGQLGAEGDAAHGHQGAAGLPGAAATRRLDLGRGHRLRRRARRTSPALIIGADLGALDAHQHAHHGEQADGHAIQSLVLVFIVGCPSRYGKGLNTEPAPASPALGA